MNQSVSAIAEKLDYILGNYVSASEVTRAFGFKSNTMISNMRKGQTNMATLHMEGLEKHFDIPVEVFHSHIKTEEEIDQLIEEYRDEKIQNRKKAQLQEKILKKLEKEGLIHKDIFNKQLQRQGELDDFIKKHKKELLKSTQTNMQTDLSKTVFPNNEKLFQKLQGVWYGYIYPSNPASAEHGVWEVKTIISEDYSVVDEPWGNRGYIKLGKHESLIIKESYDNDDLTIIRFSNRQVPSSHFRFVIISNQNNTLHEMVNFGFFSRQQYSPDEAKEILGDIDSKQLKLDLGFNDRLNERAVVPQ